jgi:hypothetical protein
VRSFLVWYIYFSSSSRHFIDEVVIVQVLSTDYQQGQELFATREFQANEEFYQRLFELGRRHKIMNPDKMRTTYGKLIYILQVRVMNFFTA